MTSKEAFTRAYNILSEMFDYTFPADQSIGNKDADMMNVLAKEIDQSPGWRCIEKSLYSLSNEEYKRFVVEYFLISRPQT